MRHILLTLNHHLGMWTVIYMWDITVLRGWISNTLSWYSSGTWTLLHMLFPNKTYLCVSLSLIPMLTIEIVRTWTIQEKSSKWKYQSWRINKTGGAETSLVVQWLGLHAPTAGYVGWITGWRTRIQQAAAKKKKQGKPTTLLVVLLSFRKTRLSW